MFERFTTRARQAVVAAQEEARGLGHGFIGTEHVLLGLLAGDPEALARRALNRVGVTHERTRREVAELIPAGDDVPSGHIPFTPRAKKALELALREALGLGHNYIGTEHILLGIVREGEGVAMQVIERQGATGEQLREQVLAELKAVTGDRSTSGTAPATTPGAQGVLAAARSLAGDAPMATHHLLEALALADGSVAGNVLAALGVDADSVAAKIDETGVEGTSDVTPELAATARMEIYLDDESVGIVFGDDTVRELVGRLVGSMGNPITGANAAESLIQLWRANVVALEQLAEQLASPDDETDAGRSATIRDAIRARLRRR